MKQYAKDISVEEIISRLKKGEVLHTKYNTQYKMVNGVLCYFGHNSTYINAGTEIANNVEECHFIIPDSFELEIGKVYRTRDNRKVFISGYGSTTTIYKYKGVVVNSDSFGGWTADGKHSLDPNPLDIISEWSD